MRHHFASAFALAAATTALGCTGGIGDTERDGLRDEVAQAQMAVPSGARRLSRVEYDNTLRDLLGDTTRSGFSKLPEDVHDPFDNDYRSQTASAVLVESAETLAEEAALRALADESVRSEIVPCVPSGPSDKACMTQFVASFGRRALRRTLAADEVERYVALQQFAIEAGDFWVGVELALRALLQDVEFLYRVEIGTPVQGVPGVYRLNDFEVATRLSFFLLGSTPDDALLDLAAAGQLRTPEQVQNAAATLLTDPRARERVDRFHALWLGYHQLPHTAELTQAMRQESRALVERVVFDDKADYFELFRADQSFLSDVLAGHYELPAPSSSEGAWVSYGESERRGILSHGSVLSAFGKFADTSPTQRGLFIRTRLLCQDIPPPPPEVNADQPPESPEAECKEDQYAAHANVGSCASCHKQMDPIGFGLERYDRAGRFRTHDDGKPQCTISGDGALEGIGAFNGPAELAELLIDTGMLENCLVHQVYRFAVGRREKSDDAPLIKDVVAGFKESGHAFDRMLIEIVAAPSFGFRKQEEE